MRDLASNVKVSVGLTPQTIATDTTTVGAIIDTKGFSSLTFALAAEWTDGTYTPLVEDGDDSGLSDAAAVVDSELLPTSDTGPEADAALAADGASKIGYAGNKRYVRLSVVSASTSVGAVVSAVAVQDRASLAPVA